MSKKSEILKIWQECFPGDSPAWRRMFFDAVYVDDEALTSTDSEGSTIVSSLLLLSYSITYQAQTLGLAYIYGAGTLRKHRAQGHMGRLMHRALAEAAERGDTFAALIPASTSLRQYYRRFGFASTFFYRPERYTAIHLFPVKGEYVDLSEAAPASLYPAFDRMLGCLSCAVRHSRAQFLTIMDDCRLSGNAFAAVAPINSPDSPSAMAWAAPDPISEEMKVVELLADDEDSANAALNLLAKQLPNRTITLCCQPAQNVAGGNFTPTAMARLVNVESALRALAVNHPGLSVTIRVTDPIIADNCGYYFINHGSLTVADTCNTPPNLDLDVTTLTSLLFSSTSIGNIFGLPAIRPHMTLMLD